MVLGSGSRTVSGSRNKLEHNLAASSAQPRQLHGRAGLCAPIVCA